jgi:carbon monoxide dehydrogenase subunit G
MQMNDSQRIPAPKEKVWAALERSRDIEAVHSGCQSLDISLSHRR